MLSIIKKITLGDHLELVREPSNVHDTKAVGIYISDHRKLVYIPCYLNEVPAVHLDNGKKLSALVHRVTLRLPPWEMLEVAVMIYRG